MLNYLTFVLKDPQSNKIRVVGVKYKKSPFTEKDIQKIIKSGTSNLDVKSWLKSLKEKDLSAEIEIMYEGQDSREACFVKQQVIIRHKDEDVDLISPKVSVKQYTKKHRANDEMRSPIIDQNGIVYPGVLEAGEKLLLAPSNISKVLHGKLDHIGGYVFKLQERDS